MSSTLICMQPAKNNLWPYARHLCMWWNSILDTYRSSSTQGKTPYCIGNTFWRYVHAWLAVLMSNTAADTESLHTWPSSQNHSISKWMKFMTFYDLVIHRTSKTQERIENTFWSVSFHAKPPPTSHQNICTVYHTALLFCAQPTLCVCTCVCLYLGEIKRSNPHTYTHTIPSQYVSCCLTQTLRWNWNVH